MEELLQKLKERLLGAKLDDCISSGAYRDISQLITEIEQLALYNVVGQSEQLCDHPRSERSYIGQNMLRCNKCGKEFS